MPSRQVSKRSARLIDAAARVVEPVARVLPDQWADRHRFFPATSGRPGQWDTAEAPYTRGPMRAAVDPGIARVGFVMPSQAGKTAAAINLMLWRLDTDPAKVLYIGPTQNQCRTIIHPKIDEAIQFCPPVKAKTVWGQSYTRTLKRIAGVTLRLAWARSKSEITSDDAGFVLVDELDRAPRDIEHEGGLVGLADARHTAYVDGKTIIFSTPTEGLIETAVDERTGLHHWRVVDVERQPIGSQVWEFWQGGSRHEYAAPCPECAAYFIPRLALLFIPDHATPLEAKEAARLECPNCGSLIAQRDRRFMRRHGVYVAPGQKPLDHCDGDTHARVVDYTASPTGSVVHTLEFGDFRMPADAVTDDATFHVSGLMSYAARDTWGNLASALVKTGKDPEKRKAVVNTKFGECFAVNARTVRAEDLKQRRERWRMRTLPEGVLLVTVGIDVQANRFAVMHVGWGREETAWILDYVELPGDPTIRHAWREVSRHVRRPIAGAEFSLLPALIAADAGNWIDEVLRWVGSENNAIAVKGSQFSQRPIIGYPSRQAAQTRSSGRRSRRDVPLWPVGTDTAKHALVARIRGDADRELEERRIHFPADLPEEALDHLASERWDERAQRWILPPGIRNEALDCLVYAYAAACHPRIRVNAKSDEDWGRLEEELSNREHRTTELEEGRPVALPPPVTYLDDPYLG